MPIPVPGGYDVTVDPYQIDAPVLTGSYTRGSNFWRISQPNINTLTDDTFAPNTMIYLGVHNGAQEVGDLDKILFLPVTYILNYLDYRVLESQADATGVPSNRWYYHWAEDGKDYWVAPYKYLYDIYYHFYP